MDMAELVEATTLYYGLAVDVLSFYMTVTSGFLIVAYLAGSKLSRPQVFIISTLYIGMAALAAYAATVWVLRGYFFAYQQLEMDDSIPIYATYGIPYCLGLFLFGGIIACMKFMWDVRHPKTE